MPKPTVKILAPACPGQHLSGCQTGQYLRFADADTRKKERWDVRAAYQYLGPVGKTKYAKVKRVDGGGVVQVPRTAQVIRLRLVSIELQPEEA